MAVPLSSATNEHYTPPEIVAAAREVLGEIDLDPATCAVANRVVRARLFCSEQQSGLDQSWTSFDDKPARVFLNPPGGKLNPHTLEPLPRDEHGKQNGPGVSSAAVWWAKLIYEWRAGHVEQAIFVCFSLAVFKTAQGRVGPLDDCPAPYSFPFVVCSDRLKYWNERTPIGTGAPQQDSAIVYLPPGERRIDPAPTDAYVLASRSFRDAFASFGAVRL